jgi:hypothetical protein
VAPQPIPSASELRLREVVRSVRFAPVRGGYPRLVPSPDGIGMVGRRARGWTLEPGGHPIATEDARHIVYSPDGQRVVVQSARDMFDVHDATTGKRLARIEGTAPGWASTRRVVFLDPAGRVARADSDDGGRRTTGPTAGCTGVRGRFRDAGECRLAFANEQDALFYSMDYAVPHELRRVVDGRPEDLLPKIRDEKRKVRTWRVGSTGVLCVSLESTEPARIPPRPLDVPTEIMCASPPWDRFVVVMRGDYYWPDIQVIGDDAVLVSWIVEPSQRVYSSSPWTPRSHCVVQRATLASRCTAEARFATGWTVLPDGKTVVAASLPPRWPRPLLIDLEAETFAPIGTVAEYQDVEIFGSHSDRFAIGLDGSRAGGEGDRIMVLGTIL